MLAASCHPREVVITSITTIEASNFSVTSHPPRSADAAGE